MKSIKSVILILISFVLIFGTITVDAKPIKLNKQSATVINGNYLYLSMEGTKDKVTWTSSNEYLASVSKDGKVTTKGIGKVKITAKVGKKKYICNVTIIPNIKPGYKTDKDLETELAERDYLDSITGPISDTDIIFIPATDSATNKSTTNIEDMIKYRFSSSEVMESEIGKEYLNFCSEWVSEYELKYYGINVTQSASDSKIYIIIDTDHKYTLNNAPKSFTPGKIYTLSNIQCQYLDKFEYKDQSIKLDQLFFSRSDLISKNVIKK